MALRRLTLCALLVSVVLPLMGCASQRPLPKVREDGQWAFERGNYEQALNDFTEYVDRRPQDAQGRFDLGKTLLKLDRPGDAREQLVLASDMQPGNDAFVDAYAQALVEAGESGEMIRLLRERAEASGRPADFMRLGRFAAKAGDPDEAVRALKTAAQLDRGINLAPQMALADFYQSIGDNPSALRRLRMALWIEPNNQDVYAKIRQLGEIPGPSLAIQPEELTGQ